MDFMLANIYSPNKEPDTFLKKVLKKLEVFKEGKLIIAGDVNLSIDPWVDTTGGPSRYTLERQKAVKYMLLEYQLVNAWRVRHPGKRDYTFSSPVLGTFSRIDYILIKHQLLPSPKNVEIKAITLSDHTPVVIQLKISRSLRGGRNWRLNNSLI